MAKQNLAIVPIDPPSPGTALAHVHVHARAMPAVRKAELPSEAPSVQTRLTAALRLFSVIEADIAKLNRRKSDLFRELKSEGFDLVTVRRLVKEKRLNPEVRALNERLFQLYWDTLGDEMPVSEAGDGQ